MTFTEYLNGLEPGQAREHIASLVEQFEVADQSGVKVVRETFKRLFEECKSNYKDLAELVLVVHHFNGLHYQMKHKTLGDLYAVFYYQAYYWGVNYIKGDDLKPYLNTTDIIMSEVPAKKYQVLAMYAIKQCFELNEKMLYLLDRDAVVDYDADVTSMFHTDYGVYVSQLNIDIYAETEEEEFFNIGMSIEIITRIDQRLNEREIEDIIKVKVPQEIWSRVILTAQNMLSAGGLNPQLIADLAFDPDRDIILLQ